MRGTLLVLAALGLTLIGSVSSAGLVDIPTVLYEADALPEDSQPAWWRQTPSDPVAEITPTGELHLVIDRLGDGLSNGMWQLDNPIPSHRNAIFVEIRVKVVSTNWQDTLLSLVYGNVSSRIYISTESVGFGTHIGRVYQFVVNNTNRYHVYRLEFYPNTETYKMYTDGTLRFTSSRTMTTSLPDRIRIGNWGSDWQAEMYIDYVRAGYMSQSISGETNSWGTVKSWFQQ